MIINAEIINQPDSGEFSERIYDNESAWNSQNWTWIKFTNDDKTEWCGNFRGFPKNVAISKRYNSLLVLTSDYLFLLDKLTGDLIEIERQLQYINLTVTPNGDYILSDYNNIEKITKDLKLKTLIKSPIEMDMIEFKNWQEKKLEFSCDEFTNWDRHLIMIYDCETDLIEIKTTT